MLPGAVTGAILGVLVVLVLDMTTSPSWLFSGDDAWPTFGWQFPRTSSSAHRGWSLAMDIVDLARFTAAGALAAIVARRTALGRW